MPRFPFSTPALGFIAFLTPWAVFAQSSPGADAGAVPSGTPAVPAAAAPSAAPSSAVAPAPAPPSGNPGGSVDRGSLLQPAPIPAAPPTGAGAAPQAAAPPPAPVADAPRDHPRRTDASIGANPKDIYAEDWWIHSRPVFEVHGYLRLRAELFHNFSLGRNDPPGVALWPQPPDNSYTDTAGGRNEVLKCGDSLQSPCQDKSQAGANMRFRMNPELHLSDNLRILSQVDLLDNLVLGSTPNSFPPGSNPYAPIGAVANTQAPPTIERRSRTVTRRPARAK